MLKEFAYLKWIRKQLKYPQDVFIPSGDDAAGIRIANKHLLLLTTDLIVEGIDFRLNPRNPSNQWFWIGHKALAVTLSDIAAMGGASGPLYALATVALRKNLSNRFAKELFRGMKSLADRFRVRIIGGDVSSTRGPISISFTLIGLANGLKPIRRSGARRDDAIMVTGRLGGSRLGRHLHFIPRLQEARMLNKKYRLNSMIDISDGLLADLNHILEASHNSAVLFEPRIPISAAARRLARQDHKSPLHHSLSDGEDFELLFTLSQKEAGKLLRAKNLPVSLVGVIRKGKGIFLQDKTGRLRRLRPKGYEHF